MQPITSCSESMRPLQSMKSMSPLQSIATNQFQPPIHLGNDITAEGGQISYAPKKRSDRSWFVQYVMCTKNCHQISQHRKRIFYMICTKNLSMYEIHQSDFILSRLTHNWPTMQSWKGGPLSLDLGKSTNQGSRISRIAIEPENAFCHPEYHLWKVRRPKCRPPWLADRILSGPRSSLSSKGL